MGVFMRKCTPTPNAEKEEAKEELEEKKALLQQHDCDDDDNVYSNDARSPTYKKKIKETMVIVLAAVLILTSAIWICSSVVCASCNTWVAVPFIGYCRWDIAVLFLSVQATFMYMSWTTSLIPLVAILFLLSSLPYLPENFRPMMYLKSIADFGAFSEGVSVHSTGFSQDEAAALVEMTMKHKDRWTHITMASALAYFNFGSSINFDKAVQFMNPSWKVCSFRFGCAPTDDVLKHESSFRDFFHDDMKEIQSILQIELAPKLRQVLANTIGIDHDQVVFGNEIEGGYESQSLLGMPAIGVIFPHVLWHWIQNPHTDGIYQNRVPKHIVPCEKADEVTTFLIPLTAPEGSGLRYWEKEDDGNVVMNEVYYEVGSVYTFLASDTLHAIRPLPYFEWKRSSYRINVQAFGVQCDDLKWYIYQ